MFHGSGRSSTGKREKARFVGTAFLVGDLVTPLLKAGFAGKFDVVTANPPYILTGEIETLSPTV